MPTPRFINSDRLADLQARAAAWDEVVAAISPDDPAAVTAADVIEHIRSTSESHSDQSVQVQQLTAQITERDNTIRTMQATIDTLENKPAATPAQAVSDGEPAAQSGDDYDRLFTGNEEFMEAVQKAGEFINVPGRKYPPVIRK